MLAYVLQRLREDAMNENTCVQIEVYSDTICPWCFIGKRRFERALVERPDVKVDLTWMPFQLNPDMPPDGMEREAYLSLKFGGTERAQDVYTPIEQAGVEEDIEFRFKAMQRTPNTLGSHRLIHYAKERTLDQDRVVEALFAAYFSRGEDIGDVEVLVECALQAGLEADTVRDYLVSETDKEQIRTQDVIARQMGIQGVPFFVFARKYAVSGAQSPAVFVQVFDTLREETSATSV